MTTAESNVSPTSAWLMAARPQTLPAAIAPVLVGTALAVHDHVFAPLPAALALLGAALIQIGTNFANDYYDAKHGADTDDREGFTRVTQSGLIAASQVKTAAIVTFGLAIASGTYLVYVGGLPILVIGLTGVLFGWAYTGGPYPLGYHGLGDVFVFVYFGLVAVGGTYYVQAADTLVEGVPLSVPPEAITALALLAGVPIGALATAILVVNNLRDIDTDRETGKRTLAVRYGRRFSKYQWASLVGLAYLIPVWLWIDTELSTFVLVPVLTIPHAILVGRLVWREVDLNFALERTGMLLTLYAITFAGGLILA
ncbi:1,4-dihydroxy-2-naphthoate octaprenyltransferase [Halovivax ruber XH-70]|uniref:1,4-dihydroxy-2-naphthoate octaprenyltransferase n=1 Tax=Halovivax ruber (strain DSM 18193 / JCM 13892 / XH-70) TaxID=797302 RepID=L0IAV4_HALRX|nr:1,4-dihydroxy-2-naphthoate polyprenyltransferase [Halovivax ruber]AGB15948.1 1,4-dihydroxy-2-naphthoate octaprenyltransferase [Halovivax ruber XH-70]